MSFSGYAWSGGGQKIIRVDVTADGGTNWHTAEITDEDVNTKSPHNWSWSLWKAEIPVKPGTKKVHFTSFFFCILLAFDLYLHCFKISISIYLNSHNLYNILILFTLK